MSEGPPLIDPTATDVVAGSSDLLERALEAYLCARDGGEPTLAAEAFFTREGIVLDRDQTREFKTRLAAFEVMEQSLSQLEAVPPLTPGQILGRYRILALAGRGGMGEVYRARDEKLGRDVALKLISPARARDPRMRRRFEREARSAGALSHPYLVTVFDLEEADGRLFLVMEFVAGMTLRDLPADAQPSREERIRIMIEIARAVAIAHRAGIVHRDLKPENLMLCVDGTPKVLDFGLAKPLMTEGLGATSHTGQVLGTSWYMSPEQVRGRELTPASDQFSLAIVLFEWLSGVRPFGGESAFEIAESIVKRPPVRLPLSTPSDIEIERVLLRALEKEPERRYEDLESFAKDLERTISGRQSRGGRPPRADRGMWRRAIFAAILLSLLLAALKLGLDRLRPASEDAAHNIPAIAILPYRFSTSDGGADRWGEHVESAVVKELERSASRLALRIVEPNVLREIETQNDRLEHAYRHGAVLAVEPHYYRRGNTMAIELRLFDLQGSRQVLAVARSDDHLVFDDAYAVSGQATREAIKRLAIEAQLGRGNP